MAPWPRLSDSFYVFTFYTLYFSNGPDNLGEPTSADSKNPVLLGSFNEPEHGGLESTDKKVKERKRG